MQILACAGALLLTTGLLCCKGPVDPARDEVQRRSEQIKVPVADTLLVASNQPAQLKDTSLINDLCFAYVARPERIRMFWKNDGVIISTFEELLKIMPGLRFAMNGGMFTKAFGPVGLYVEKGRTLKPVRRYNNPKVNFGLQPQGVFLLRGNRAEVIPVDQYDPQGVQYATQSAPMLVLNSSINPRLPHSKSKTIRNGVGVLPDGRVLLAVSNVSVTFQEFAQYFVSKGCTAALYLDGAISGAYASTRDDGGSYGVLIGVVD